MVVKIWNVIFHIAVPYSHASAYQRFGGTYHLQLQDLLL